MTKPEGSYEIYPGDDHRQIYWSWRHYPRAMKHSLLLGGMVGFSLGCAMTLIILTIRGVI